MKMTKRAQELPMSKEPKIEKNVPIPTLNQNREGVYYETWHKLKPGDSLFYQPENGEDVETLIWRIRARKNNFKRAHPHLKWKIITRAVEGGIRVWRTE